MLFAGSPQLSLVHGLRGMPIPRGTSLPSTLRQPLGGLPAAENTTTTHACGSIASLPHSFVIYDCLFIFLIYEHLKNWGWTSLNMPLTPY